MVYIAGTILTAGILLNTFLKDKTTSKTEIASWVTLAIATILWPVTLPTVIRKKLQKQVVFDLRKSALLSDKSC
jgi:hypothetical protein